MVYEFIFMICVFFFVLIFVKALFISLVGKDFIWLCLVSMRVTSIATHIN